MDGNSIESAHHPHGQKKTCEEDLGERAEKGFLCDKKIKIIIAHQSDNAQKFEPTQK